ncbi:hypothetical protein GUITHDRAFT_100352 [Guillardia theta CCMP2712]|uniref:PARP-type domain-containing protein n=1 Tax=Guillardia theta (strain CCMP2712) TaxID=905079 RepID=L1K0X4_GUITC|nr:hypothetical protein GUITHDRAFT_100352 [Guillardia theta CCMP2712]EKX54105.1 hypothetical protein GUITHDRAFT_100352 [Guillardia theta CCMP2712]|eukprot:XP_005841085.1 hypothetical protein GUITHDRAFT_100352 [Guillardia theta CCMP2712]
MPVLRTEAEKEQEEKKGARQELEEDSLFKGVFLEDAKSGRAKCPACQEKIPTGDKRVGVDTFRGGRFVVSWLHPSCFLKNTLFDYNKSGRGKCKVTKSDFIKGQLRLGYRNGMESYGYACIDGAAKFLPEILEADQEFRLEDVSGWGELSEADQSLIQSKLAPEVQQSGSKRHGGATEKDKGGKKKSRKQ